MFEGGTPDMSALLAQAQRLQEELVAAKDRLAEARVEGSAASGLVTATVSGTGELLDVTIKPEACDPDDADAEGDSADTHELLTRELGARVIEEIPRQP